MVENQLHKYWWLQTSCIFFFSPFLTQKRTGVLSSGRNAAVTSCMHHSSLPDLQSWLGIFSKMYSGSRKLWGPVVFLSDYNNTSIWVSWDNFRKTNVHVNIKPWIGRYETKNDDASFFFTDDTIKKECNAFFFFSPFKILHRAKKTNQNTRK